MKNLLPVFSHGSYDVHSEVHALGEFFQIWKDGVIVAQRDTLAQAREWISAKYKAVKVELVAHTVVADRFDVVVTYKNGETHTARKQEVEQVAQSYMQHLNNMYRLA